MISNAKPMSLAKLKQELLIVPNNTLDKLEVHIRRIRVERDRVKREYFDREVKKLQARIVQLLGDRI